MATRHGTFKGAEDLYRRKCNNGDFKTMVQTTLLAQDQKESVSLFGTEHEGSHSNYMNKSRKTSTSSGQENRVLKRK